MPALILRERRPEDLPLLHRWLQTEAEWHRWDGPYFNVSRPPTPHNRLISLDGTCIGQVSRAERTPVGCGCWDLGLVIHDPADWGGGLGTRALGLWTDATFRETDAHVLILSTWGGNERMIRAAGRAGYRECGRVPEARACEDGRWDSVCLALLRRDWEELRPGGLSA